MKSSRLDTSDSANAHPEAAPAKTQLTHTVKRAAALSTELRGRAEHRTPVGRRFRGCSDEVLAAANVRCAEDAGRGGRMIQPQATG